MSVVLVLSPHGKAFRKEKKCVAKESPVSLRRQPPHRHAHHFLAHVEPAFVYKKRDATSGDTSVTGVNADVRGKEVVIYDDMIRTGSSLLQAAKSYVSAGATKVHAIASHLVLPGNSLEKLRATGVFTSIMGTNSHPGSEKLAKEDIVSIAPLMIETLKSK